jgi:hypothetical protein
MPALVAVDLILDDLAVEAIDAVVAIRRPIRNGSSTEGTEAGAGEYDRGLLEQYTLQRPRQDSNLRHTV